MSTFRRRLLTNQALRVAKGDLIYPGLVAAWSAEGKTNEDSDRDQNLADLVGLYVEKYNEVSTLSNESLLIEDFIPPMKIEKDHYYKEDGIVYKCIQSSKLSISNSLKDLIGYYVEIYKE